MTSYDLLPEEEKLLITLVEAWANVPPGGHQPFLIHPWGDTVRTLSHPGLPANLEVPEVYLESLDDAHQDGEGRDRGTAEVVASDVQFPGRRGDRPTSEEPAARRTVADDEVSPDEIPF